MYAIAAEMFPKGGGLTIGMIGFVGMLGVSIWIPRIGMLSDSYGLIGAFKIVSILPLVVFVIFAIWWIKLRRNGGYSPVNLATEIQDKLNS
jgi:nitrate/nitrite transporter NarK